MNSSESYHVVVAVLTEYGVCYFGIRKATVPVTNLAGISTIFTYRYHYTEARERRRAEIDPGFSPSYVECYVNVGTPQTRLFYSLRRMLG
jgi:hypothetical protein